MQYINISMAKVKQSCQMIRLRNLWLNRELSIAPPSSFMRAKNKVDLLDCLDNIKNVKYCKFDLVFSPAPAIYA